MSSPPSGFPRGYHFGPATWIPEANLTFLDLRLAKQYPALGEIPIILVSAHENIHSTASLLGFMANLIDLHWQNICALFFVDHYDSIGNVKESIVKREVICDLWFLRSKPIIEAIAIRELQIEELAFGQQEVHLPMARVVREFSGEIPIEFRSKILDHIGSFRAKGLEDSDARSIHDRMLRLTEQTKSYYLPKIVCILALNVPELVKPQLFLPGEFDPIERLDRFFCVFEKRESPSKVKEIRCVQELVEATERRFDVKRALSSILEVKLFLEKETGLRCLDSPYEIMHPFVQSILVRPQQPLKEEDIGWAMAGNRQASERVKLAVREAKDTLEMLGYLSTGFAVYDGGKLTVAPSRFLPKDLSLIWTINWYLSFVKEQFLEGQPIDCPIETGKCVVKSEEPEWRHQGLHCLLQRATRLCKTFKEVSVPDAIAGRWNETSRMVGRPTHLT